MFFPFSVSHGQGQRNSYLYVLCSVPLTEIKGAAIYIVLTLSSFSLFLLSQFHFTLFSHPRFHDHIYCVVICWTKSTLTTDQKSSLTARLAFILTSLLLFNKDTSKTHPKMEAFIACLQVEEAVFQQQSVKLKAGSQKKKRSKTLGMQKQIDHLGNRFYNDQIDRVELLDGLSLLVASKK